MTEDKLKEKFEDLIAQAPFVSDGWQSTFEYKVVLQLMQTAAKIAIEEKDNG